MNEMLRLIIYFMIYAFIGWVLESVYKSVLQKKFVNSGFLSGPFCPMYGYGAIMMYLSLKDVSNNIVILFLYGLIILSIYEYVVGLFLETVFKTKYWDYSNYKFNIHGRVCLLNSIYWGILGVVFMKFIHPAIEVLVSRIPINYLIIFAAISCTYILIDTLATVIRLVKINIRLRNLEQITKAIKDKIEKINVKTAGKYEAINKIKREKKYKILRKIVEIKHSKFDLSELSDKQKEIQAKLEKKIARLRKAFPTMNSKRLNKFFNNSKKS